MAPRSGEDGESLVLLLALGEMTGHRAPDCVLGGHDPGPEHCPGALPIVLRGSRVHETRRTRASRLPLRTGAILQGVEGDKAINARHEDGRASSGRKLTSCLDNRVRKLAMVARPYGHCAVARRTSMRA